MQGFPGNSGIAATPFGEGLEFRGINQVVKGSTRIAPGTYESVTVEFWFCLQKKGAANELLLQWGTCENLSFHRVNEQLWARIAYAGEHCTLTVPHPGIGKWHHLLAVRDGAGKEFRLYMDGKLAGKKAAPRPVGLLQFSRTFSGWQNYPPVLHIGNGDKYHQHPLTGMIDEVRLVLGVLSEEEIAKRADRKLVTAQKPDRNAASDSAIRRTRALLTTLFLGEQVMKRRGYPQGHAMMGSYIFKKLQGFSKQLDEIRRGKQRDINAIRNLHLEMERIEDHLVQESIRVIPPLALSPERFYATRPPTPDRLRAYVKKFMSEIDAMFLDWKRNTATMKRFGISVDAGEEMARIRMRWPVGGNLLELDRTFTQAVAFYKAVAVERFRLASGCLAAAREIDALQKTMELRRGFGAELGSVESLKKAALVDCSRWKHCIQTGAYGTAANYEDVFKKKIRDMKKCIFAKTEGVPVIRPGASFRSTGRFAFGGSWHGLPNCEARGATLYRDSKTAFQPYEDDSVAWRVSFEVPDTVIEGYEVRDASWTHSHREYTYRCLNKNQTIRQECWWSMLAVGTLTDTHGPEIIFFDSTKGNPVPPDKVLGVFGTPMIKKKGDVINPAEMTEGWLVFLWENGAPQMPLLVFFEHRPEKFVWRKDGLLAQRDPEIGRCVAALPYGAVPQMIDWSRSWNEVPVDVVEQCRKVVEHLVFYPLSIDEFYSVGDEKIRIWNRLSEVIEIEDEWKTKRAPYIPVPLLYTLGLEAGVPIEFEQLVAIPLMATKYGFYRTVKGRELSYTIPRIRMWERHVLKPAEETKLTEAFNKLVYNNNTGEVQRFHQIASFHSGWCLMDSRTRHLIQRYKNEQLLDSIIAGQTSVKAFHWEHDFEIESTQGKSYWVRAWRGNRHDVRMRGDAPNLQNFQLCLAYTSAKLFGRWDLIEKHWDAMLDTYSCVVARQAWAMPGHDCMTSGWIFSGDMLGDGWRNHHLLGRMARTLGKTDEAALTDYLGARTMMTIGCTLHPNTLTYNAHVKNTSSVQDPNASVMVGANDLGLYTGTYGLERSWCANWWIAGCTVFDYPFWGVLLDNFPRTTQMYEEFFLKQFESWSDPEGAYRGKDAKFRFCRRGNAWLNLKTLCWVTKDRSSVRDIYTKGFAPPKDKTYADFLTWQFGGNALPHIIAQNDPAWLVDWDQAKIEEGTYSRRTGEVTVKLSAPRAAELLMVSLVKPAGIAINGKKLERGQYSYEQTEHELRIPFQVGPHTISIMLDSHDPKKLKYPDFEAQPMGTPLKLSKAPAPGILEKDVAIGDLKVEVCEPIDISSVCNMGFADDVAGDHRGGTHDDGESWGFPTGNVRFRGVPFTIIDPAKNNGKSCLVLRGKKKGFFPKQVQNIQVNRRFRRLFFFHGTCYTGKADAQSVLMYVLHFEGNQTRTISIRRGVNIGEWKVPPNAKEDSLPDLSEARAVPIFAPIGKGSWGKGASGYIYAWDNTVRAPGVTNLMANQRALAKLESIDIVSLDIAVPMVFAITGESAK